MKSQNPKITVSLPVYQLLAAYTNSSFIVMSDTHFMGAALHLQTWVFGWIKSYKKKQTSKKKVRHAYEVISCLT